MLETFYKDQLRRRNQLNPLIKVLLVLSIVFFVYRMGPVVHAWYLDVVRK